MIRLLRFIALENSELLQPPFWSVEVGAPVGTSCIAPWEVRLSDGVDSFECADRDLIFALRGAMNLCCSSWWELAKKEQDPDCRRNLKETHRRLAQAADYPGFKLRQLPRKD